MSRYTYVGPYDGVEVGGVFVVRGDSFDAADDNLIADINRRGFHIFRPAEGDAAQATETPAEAPAEVPAEVPAEAPPEEAPPA